MQVFCGELIRAMLGGADGGLDPDRGWQNQKVKKHEI